MTRAILADVPDEAYANLLLGRTLQRQGRHAEAKPHLAMAELLGGYAGYRAPAARRRGPADEPTTGTTLEFGLFPRRMPRAPRVLELAGVAEVSGLDLVTVQDHPYQARHLDAWTLLSVIAARTSTLRVAPNVANLPLRNPVVLAGSVASLDLLSGGRVELGIGAGGFSTRSWPRAAPATPGEAVDALEEAIGIIRAMWAGRGSVRIDGVHHRALGVQAGPAPAHPVGIWVGAYKPRMLRLTGRLADGWLPSAGYAGPEVLGEMNARIDDAAVTAGASTGAVRRLYNVSGSFTAPGGPGLLQGRPADWAERLAELTLEHGMATYILATDDVDDVRRFGEEVAPEVRDLVATERERRAAGEADAGGRARRPSLRTASRRAAPKHSLRSGIRFDRPPSSRRRPTTAGGSPASCRGTRRAGPPTRWGPSPPRRWATGRRSSRCRSTSRTCTTTCAAS